MRLGVARLGSVEYQAAVALQERLVAERASGGEDVLLLLEHPAVYTLGRGADPAFLGAAGTAAVPVVRTSRGGQVTYHGPGQLVGYPILDLRGHRCDVRWYVGQLEAVLIAAAGRFGLGAKRRAGFPGVWIGERKLASIGVAIRRWVTWHGFALNVGPDLAAFDAITPCGLTGVRMTSLAVEGRSVGVDEAARVVAEEFAGVFGYATRSELGWLQSDAAGAPA